MCCKSVLLSVSILALVILVQSHRKGHENPSHTHTHSLYQDNQHADLHRHDNHHHPYSGQHEHKEDYSKQVGGHHQQHQEQSHSPHKHDHPRPGQHVSNDHDHHPYREAGHHKHHLRQRDVNHCQGGHRDKGHSHRHHGEQKLSWQAVAPPVEFQVYKPKGLEVSIVKYFPEMTSFGIQLFVNRHPDQSCDICQNVTKTAYGKYIIRDDHVVIRKGDTLYYNLLIGNGDDVYQYRLQRIIIIDSMVSRCNCEQDAERVPDIDIRIEDAPEIPASADTMAREELDNDITDEREEAKASSETLSRQARQNGLAPMVIDLAKEIEKLESMVRNMKNNCISDMVSKTLVMRGRLIRNDAIGEFMQYMDKKVSSHAELSEVKQHINIIMPAFGENEAALIEMDNYMDKQALLHYARKNRLDRLGDYDCIQGKKKS